MRYESKEYDRKRVNYEEKQKIGNKFIILSYDGCVELRAGMKRGIAYLTLTVGDKTIICKVTVTN